MPEPTKAQLLAEVEALRKALKRAEAKAKRHEARLDESLAEHIATREILAVISCSPADVQPVFDTIVRNAGAVCHAFDASVFVRDGDHLRLVAHTGPIEAHTIGTRFA